MISVVVVFAVIRVTNDVGNLASGVAPAVDDFDRRYFDNPVIAYAHIIPGVVYLLGAPLQLSSSIRHSNIRLHRTLGKIVLPAGLATGFMAIVVGIVMPFGKAVEAWATIVFGFWFMAALVIAYRAIRAARVPVHRRWMLRAFAVGVGVGMIRIVVGIGTSFGIPIEDSFGVAFWIAFALLALTAELWLRLRPEPYS